MTLASVTPSATNIAAGTNGQITLALSGPATVAMSVALTSSNPSVILVLSPVTIPIGSSSANVTITAVAPGTATISALLNGGSKQSPTITVTGLALASISLSPSTVVGGNAVTGTATLSAPAPVGGVVVPLTAGDPATIPPSVALQAGATTATFPVTTHAVASNTTVTIGGSFGGVSASAVLTVTRPTTATAKFGVRGPTESETCELSNGGATLNCTFDGTTSSAPGNITEYDWTYSVSGSKSVTTTGPVLTLPAFACSMMPAPPLPPGNQWFTLTVTLQIHDDQSNVSPMAIDSGARLLPQGACGF